MKRTRRLGDRRPPDGRRAAIDRQRAAGRVVLGYAGRVAAAPRCRVALREGAQVVHRADPTPSNRAAQCRGSAPPCADGALLRAPQCRKIQAWIGTETFGGPPSRTIQKSGPITSKLWIVGASESGELGNPLRERVARRPGLADRAAHRHLRRNLRPLEDLEVDLLERRHVQGGDVQEDLPERVGRVRPVEVEELRRCHRMPPGWAGGGDPNRARGPARGRVSGRGAELKRP